LWLVNKIDVGWFTDNTYKVKYAYAAREKIKEEAVFFVEDWICTNPWLQAEKRSFITKQKFFEQMSRYKLFSGSLASPFSKQKTTITGKTNESGKVSAGYNDDLMFCFTMNIYMTNEILNGNIPNLDYNKILPKDQQQ
jgi:hypothetical protein